LGITGGRDQERVEDGLLGDVRVRFLCRPGHPGWDGVGMAEKLLAEWSVVEATDRVLVAPSGHGALGVWAARQASPKNCVLCDTNVIAVETARRTLAINECAEATVQAGLPACETATLDVALVRLLKGRDLTRMLFMASFACLRPGGRLYLAGANKAGIKSAARDCSELFGEGLVLAYKGGNRVVSFSRPGTWPQPLPESYARAGVRRGTWHEFDLPFRDRVYHLRTRPGVFSWRSLDEGTRLLLDHLKVRSDERVLDVGCGYGVVGMCAADHAREGEAVLVDIDSLACDCARENLVRNGISNAYVVLGDGVSAAGRHDFTLIVSNPPFHSGQGVDLGATVRFISEARASLKARGRLVLVANQFLPYDRAMRDVFGHVETVARTRSYRVLTSSRP